MRTEKPYREGQTIADMFNRTVVGRSGTVYTPGSSMIVVHDNDRKRARLEETAVRVKVPRDPLADAMDFAGLHKDVLLGLANEEAVDAWADVWSDAVVVSRAPWGPFGALRRHAWDLSGPHLPPLLERSLRFDPHRWVTVARGYSEKGLHALLDLSPKSLDLNCGFEEALDDLATYQHDFNAQWDDDDDDDGELPAPQKHEVFRKIIRGVERIQYFENDESLGTEEVLETILPMANTITELFLLMEECGEGWLESVIKDAGRPKLTEAVRTAVEGIDWVTRSADFVVPEPLVLGQFSGDKLVVGEELFTHSECLAKAAANPFIDITTHVGILKCQRKLAGEEKNLKEEAALAVQVLEGLFQKRHVYVEHSFNLCTYADTEPVMWKVLSKYLNEARCCVTIGGVVFSSTDCQINARILDAGPNEWLDLARRLLKLGSDTKLTVIHHLIDDFTASPLTLNYLDCMYCAVFPSDCLMPSRRSTSEPHHWLEIATMMKPGDRIRSVYSWKHQWQTTKPLSAIACAQQYVKGQERRSRNVHWFRLLQLISKQGDFTATFRLRDGKRVNWSGCASLALGMAHRHADPGQTWREVAEVIPQDGVVHFEDHSYAKEDLLRHAQELDDARKLPRTTP